MKGLKDKVYRPDCSHNDPDIDAYYTRDEIFGEFIENGKAYVINRRDTPRAWTQYLCNDKIRSAVSNVGKGFIFHYQGLLITKHYEENGNYLPRNLNGERKLFVRIGCETKTYEFFTEAENFLCTVRPGYVTFEGDIGPAHIQTIIFVPKAAPCECWNVTITNQLDTELAIHISSSQDVSLFQYIKGVTYETKKESNLIKTLIGNVTNIFTADNVTSTFSEEYTETTPLGTQLSYIRETIESELLIPAKGSNCWNVISSACMSSDEEEEVKTYTDTAICQQELKKIVAMWDEIIAHNYCELPDKNLEYFLNFWLKNQIYLTYRYDRNTHLIGYRDGLQDSWGYLLVQPEVAKEKLLLCLSYMLPDGRCPRQFCKFNSNHDRKDFSDSPTWAPITLNSYIKETGDFSILEEEIPFLDSDETATVENHIYRALDYMYHNRGTNGLVLVRDGDWADGLAGINQYGEDATSVWVTIAAYHAQNLMADIYREIGQDDKADEMEKRSADYKQVVNEVGWDGNWLTYGFFADGEPIGSSRNYEGKIWLNPQTWGIFSGIIDEQKKIDKIVRSVSRYLDTPYGAMVLYPPYVFYGARCGRIQNQRPGMFLNSAIYNHAATFKIFADVKRKDYETAYDTMMRCLPNHPDNSDTRRTSEPFVIGNVYYGSEHHRYGMNSFSWFTAAPSWLIHAGFEEILGVKAGYKGLEITPHVPEDWDGYKVSKMYRGTRYHIQFISSPDEKGIWIDGQKQIGNVISSDKATCNVLVKY